MSSSKIKKPIAQTWSGSKLYFSPFQLHTLLAGATRSGKSVCSYAILSQVSKMPHVAIVGIDPSGILLTPHAEYRPDDFALSTSPNDLVKAIGILQALEQELDKRVQMLRERKIDKFNPKKMTEEFPGFLLVIEEYPGFFASLKRLGKQQIEEAERIIGRLLREGAKCLIHVLTIIQRPEAKLLTDRSQYARRISFRQDNRDSIRMLFSVDDDQDVTEILRLMPGRGVIEEPGRGFEFFTAPNMDYQTYRNRVVPHRRTYLRKETTPASP